MEKFYFTFGIGQSLLANRYVEIEAETIQEARDIMEESFDQNWCDIYTENEWVEINLAAEYGLVKLNVNEFWR